MFHDFYGSQDPIPSPNGSVVADPNKDISVATESGLPDGRSAFGVREDNTLNSCWIARGQVPDVCLPNLIAQCHHLLVNKLRN